MGRRAVELEVEACRRIVDDIMVQNNRLRLVTLLETHISGHDISSEACANTDLLWIDIYDHAGAQDQPFPLLPTRRRRPWRVHASGGRVVMLGRWT